MFGSISWRSRSARIKAVFEEADSCSLSMLQLEVMRFEVGAPEAEDNWYNCGVATHAGGLLFS